MSSLENIWFVVALSIAALILLTDPKESASNYGGSPLVGLFSSANTGQKFINRFTWTLILVFLLLTIILSYVT